jgi:hypothetical protein
MLRGIRLCNCQLVPPIIGTCTVWFSLVVQQRVIHSMPRVSAPPHAPRTPRAHGTERGPLDAICSLAVHTADRFHMAGQRSIGATGPSHAARRAWGIAGMVRILPQLVVATESTAHFAQNGQSRQKLRTRKQAVQRLQPLFCIGERHALLHYIHIDGV